MENIALEIEKCLTLLRKGGTILYPTNTIWGIGCDATNFRAVEKVYQIKQRVASKGLIVWLDDVAKLSRYIGKVPGIAMDLFNSMNTPMTVIYENAINLARNVVAADNAIAIRIVKDPFCQALVKAFGKLVVSTSANISGEPTALAFNKISKEITSKADNVANLYQDKVNELKPSTIIRLYATGEYRIMRK